jgi:glycosyltransferase involved in cell wall biosynthesis
VGAAAGEDDAPLPSVSVVVTTYRRADRLADTLRPLLADPATTEVVVVADGGGDGTEEVVRALAATDGRLRLVVPPHGGQRAAQAAGVERASGEVLLMLDDDVVARPGLVGGHASHHRGRDRLVVVGYMPCWRAERGRGLPVLTRLYSAEYEGHCAALERDTSLVLQRLWGGNVSLRRDDCRAVGLAPWPYAHDDRDFGLRCLRAGLTGVFDRRLLAEHRHERDARQFLRNARSFGAGRALLHRVHADLLGPFDADRELGHVPRAMRPAVDFFAVPARASLVTTPLRALARIARSLHLERLESAAYRVARRIEMRAGAAEVRSSSFHGSLGDAPAHG